jgi:hypothetical protein
MWADTLMAAERAHLVRLATWGAIGIVVGTLLLAWLALRRQRSPLLLHFGIQTAAWGAVIVALAAPGLRSLALRDHAGATRLAGMLWLNVGLDAGYAAVGATLALAGWALGRRLGAVGAGLAIVVQGLALLALDARFLLLVQRGTG